MVGIWLFFVIQQNIFSLAAFLHQNFPVNFAWRSFNQHPRVIIFQGPTAPGVINKTERHTSVSTRPVLRGIERISRILSGEATDAGTERRPQGNSASPEFWVLSTSRAG